MFGKLVLIIIVLGAVACALLVDRQERIDLAADMSSTHSRLRQHERSLWSLRRDIAFATRPVRIERALDLDEMEWEPIPDRLDHRRRRRLETELADVPSTPVPRGDRQEYGG